MYSRKIPDSHRLIGGRSHVFYFDFKSLGTWLFGTTVKVFGTSHTSGWIWYYIPGIQRSRTPFVFEICVIPLKPVLNTGSDESWHTLCVQLLNVCLCLPLHTHSRGQCPNARSLSVYLSPFFSNVFSVFFHWMRPTLKCTLLAVILSRFCHRPRYYTTIDFWSDLEHPSDLELVTTHAIIPQLIPGICTHAIIPQLIPGIWSGLAHPSDAKSSVIR